MRASHFNDRSQYVPEALTVMYRNTVAPLADVIVPNQFELGCAWRAHKCRSLNRPQ
jgi:pyridoxal/pyridoxine/pyridoxamine kinase